MKKQSYLLSLKNGTSYRLSLPQLVQFIREGKHQIVGLKLAGLPVLTLEDFARYQPTA